VGTFQRVLLLAQQMHDIDVARLNALAHRVPTTLYVCVCVCGDASHLNTD
jgi:hypothetical protein